MMTKQYENSVKKSCTLRFSMRTWLSILHRLFFHKSIYSLINFSALSSSLSVCLPFYLSVCISLCLSISLLLSRTYHTISLSRSLWLNFLPLSSPLHYYLFIPLRPDYTYISDIADGVIRSIDRPLGYQVREEEDVT